MLILGLFKCFEQLRSSFLKYPYTSEINASIFNHGLKRPIYLNNALEVFATPDIPVCVMKCFL